MTTKELIRAEIERLKSKYRHNGLWTSSFQSDLAMAKIESMNEILSFLDTLPDEPITTCNELEEAAEKSARQYYVDGGYSPFPNTERASHIAGFIAGAEWQKREMMEGAVEGDGEVCKLADRVWITPTDEKRFHQDVFDNFKSGDKVRIIILPEEG